MKLKTLLVAMLAFACGLVALPLIPTAHADGIPYFDNLGSVNEGTVTGTTVIKLNSITTLYQKSITITNNDDTNSLWVMPVRRGATKPTIASTRFLFAIAPGDSVTVQCGSGIDWYGLNSAGDSTATYYFVQSWR